MNHFEIFKDLYYKQLEQKEILRTHAISIPFTLLTGICAIQFYFITNFSYSVSMLLDAVFILLVLTCGTLASVSICFLVLSYNNFFKGRRYKYLNSANLIHTYYGELKEYHVKHQNKSLDEVDNIFETYLIENFVRCATHNEQQNDTRADLISKANQYLILALIALFFSAMPYLADSFLKKKSATEIKIVALNHRVTKR